MTTPITSTPPTTGIDPATIKKIQETKETAKQKADAAVMTDANAVHAAHTPWTSKPTLIAAGVGGVVAAVAGAALLPVVAVAAGVAALEHYERPFSKLADKLGIKWLQPKAPAGTPPGSKVVAVK